MDRRWPWKKKSSEKAVIEKAATALDSSDASNSQVYLFVGIFHTRNMCETFVPSKIFPP